MSLDRARLDLKQRTINYTNLSDIPNKLKTFLYLSIIFRTANAKGVEKVNKIKHLWQFNWPNSIHWRFYGKYK